MATIYFTASSADGFIADADNSLSWLLSRDVDAHGPMGYEGFVEATVGALAMGSTTYEWILEHQVHTDPPAPWPYKAPAWVFTTRNLPAVSPDVRVVSGDVAGIHSRMVEAAGGRAVWVVGGGDLAGQFVDAGLLDEMWVQYAPVTLGVGAPLLPRRVEMQLEEVDLNRDFVCARYVINKAAPSRDG